MSVVIANIGTLVTNDPSLGYGVLGEIASAAIVLDQGRVAWVGDSSAAPAADEHIDAGGHAVIPGFVDSHAHLLFAGDRSAEFAARMRGEKYTAGGINATVTATRAATDEELESNMLSLVGEMTRSGITTWETKSGYGLTPGDEARALAIASRHTSETTFLGAHVVPTEYAKDSDAYVSLILEQMLDAVAPSVKWIDVFCDRGAFDVDQARVILTAGISKGMQPRLHANQLANVGAVQLAVELGCASADHCTHLDSSDIDALAGSATVATLLPGAEFSTRAAYPDARRLLDAGATVALATDCNPGSSFTTSMPFCIALAIRDMHFTHEEALWAATMGAAQALRRSDVWRLSPGSRADLVVLNAPSYLHLGYRPGVDMIHSVMKAGSMIYKGIA